MRCTARLGMVIGILLGLCGSAFAADDPNTVISKDGLFQVAMPDGWVKAASSGDAKLHIRNAELHNDVTFADIDKSTVKSNLRDFAIEVRDKGSHDYADEVQTDISQTKVGEFDVVQWTFTARNKHGSKFGGTCAIIDLPQIYLQLTSAVGVSLLDQDGPAVKEILNGISAVSNGTDHHAATDIQPAEQPSGQPSEPLARPVTEIHGLVVMEGEDGNWHGQVLDIIATAAMERRTRNPVQITEKVGPQMKTSLDEAYRLFRIRHPQAKQSIDISFGDKFSAKDGPSAGGAFSLLMLSAVGDFEINPDAAMTGDVTVDSKIRPVGGVVAKVHGAALDGCKLVAIPTQEATDIQDSEIENGPSVLWQTQIFSIDTVDDAIAVMRKDPSANLAKAVTMFDELKQEFCEKPVSALRKPEVLDKLNQILLLAPNHISARQLMLLASGKAPEHMTAEGTVEAAITDMGPLQSGLTGDIKKSTSPSPPSPW